MIGLYVIIGLAIFFVTVYLIMKSGGSGSHANERGKNPYKLSKAECVRARRLFPQAGDPAKWMPDMIQKYRDYCYALAMEELDIPEYMEQWFQIYEPHRLHSYQQAYYQQHQSQEQRFFESPKQIAKRLPHEILGVSPNANKEEIKKAYRSLIFQYHPDKVGPLGEKIKELAHKESQAINSAYEVMMEKSK